MTVRAYVVHRIRDRTRLRIPDRKNDEEFFTPLRSKLAPLGDDVAVEINSATGSILLQHASLPTDHLDAELERIGLLLVHRPPPPMHALDALTSGVAKLDRAITTATAGSADLHTILFLAAVALAIRQLRRGHVLGPAMPLVWIALEIAGRIARARAQEDLEDLDAEPSATGPSES